MNLEFRYAKGVRLLLYTLLPIISVAIIYLGITPFLEPSTPTKKIWLPLIALGVLTLFFFGFLDLYRYKLTITKDRLIKRGPTKTKELLFADISGYRIDDKYIIIYSLLELNEKIRVSLHTERLEELKEVLNEKFVNLDEEEIAEEQEQILRDEGLGSSEEERLLGIEKARKVCRALNIGATVLMIWLFFKPQPYDLVVSIALLYPFAVLFALNRFKGFIRLDEKRNTAYPNLTNALMLPSLGALLRALLDFDLLTYTTIWITTVLLTLVLSFLFFRSLTKFFERGESKVAAIILLFGFLAGYSYGALVLVNCVKDSSTPTIYITEVLDKHMSTGKHTSYDLTLRSWGRNTENEETSVAPQFYQAVEKGDIVSVYVRKGRLGFKWFMVGF